MGEACFRERKTIEHQSAEHFGVEAVGQHESLGAACRVTGEQSKGTPLFTDCRNFRHGVHTRLKGGPRPSRDGVNWAGMPDRRPPVFYQSPLKAALQRRVKVYGPATSAIVAMRRTRRRGQPRLLRRFGLSATDASYRYGDRPVFSEIRVGRERNRAVLSGIIFMRVLGTHEFLLFVQSAPISDGRRPRPRENAVILDRELKL
jgi:hypothetical protein